MSKISELPPITGANTRTEDLFVIVNLVQGDDGTSSITRKELVQAIQYEIFDRITITGGTISGVYMSDSRIDNVVIDNSNIEDSEIIRTDFNEGSLRNSTGDNLDIENSTFDEGAITNSTFATGAITDSTAANVAITDSTFSEGAIFDSTANNVTITNSSFADGDILDSNANNVTITNSSFSAGDIFDSTANNVTITNSSFADGDILDSNANNVTITNSSFTDGTIADSVANNVAITQSTFDNGALTNSTGDTLTITNSSFTDGTIEDSTADNVDITNSTFNDGTGDNVTLTNSVIDSSEIIDSTANNVIITNSEFNDGTGNNVVLTNSTIDDSVVVNSELNDSTANNVQITNSDFSDGTGNNNVFTNTTIDQGVIQDSAIANTTFTGTMDNVIAQNMTITSSSADGFSQTRSSFDSGDVTQSTFSNGVIDQSRLVDFDMEIEKQFEAPIDENSYFALKNEKTGETEQITYKQFFDEISRTTETNLKVYVDADKGDDANPGSMLQPVLTLERASELAIEKAGGNVNRNAVNNAVHITVGPGTYYTKGNIALPDDCAMTSTAGQYATVIEALPGYENNNAILVGSGNYVQGFAFQNWKIDNFDYPEGGFAVAYRPGAKLLRSPYIRDSSQLSNFLREDVEPPLQPFNSKGNVLDLGREIFLEPGHTGAFEVDDEITFSSGAKGFVSWTDDLAGESKIYVRNLKNNRGFVVGDTVRCESGGVGTVAEIGIDDFPNPLVGRGGGCMLADRRVLDPDSLYTYVLCFGFTPRSQNGMGYVARDGAGVNGIGSLSIFVRVAFYALNGGQMTLNNSGTQFGDISMRAKGTTEIFAPKDTEEQIIGNTVFAEAITDNQELIIDDMVEYLTSNTANGGLDYTGYDADKCERDSKIIIDNAAYDITLDTNYWGRLAGITYRSPISSKVVGEQLEATLGANRYLQDRIEDLFDGEVITRANTSFQELYNVVEFGEENMNPIIFTDTGEEARTSAREIIQDNREFIQDELLDWIDNNEEFFAYDSVKCKRDVTEYILPAAKYDMLLDTNYNAVRAGGAYYMKSAEKVVGEQRNETVAAYRRLKEQTNEIIDANTFIGTSRVDAAFDEIIDILDNRGTTYTPTNATYDPSTGLSVITIGAHDLTVGRKILIAESGITFSCGTDGNVTQISHPRPTDPAFNSPIEILETTGTTITINVGKSFYTGVHTFVSADSNSIIELGSEITFSDNAAIPADQRNARKQLQSNREFVQDLVMGYIDNNYFRYDSNKCTRDILEYILPAVQRDIITGTNFNAIQTGLGYRQGTQGAQTVINEQLTETIGAITHLKELVANNTIADSASITRAEDAFDEIIDIIQNGEANTDVLIWTDPASYLSYYTPTTATYDPATGVSTVTIPGHDIQLGDYIEFAPYSFTFTCSQDGDATEHSYPRRGDGNYNTPMEVTNVAGDVITVNVGVGAGGTHTFVSASANAVAKTTYNSQGQRAREQLQANRTFLQEEIMAYLDTEYFVFDGDKCSRDTGLILDAVRRDILTGSNFSSVFAGLAYRSGNASTEVVVTDQLTETVAAIEWVRDEVNSYLSGTAQSRSTAAFNEIIDIMNNGQGNADTIVFPATGLGANEIEARQALQANKAFLQAEITAWIAENYPSLTYDSAKCERDVGYLLDSASFDVQFGGNTASVNNARLYYDNAVAILPADQRIPTARAFEHLAGVADLIVRGETVTPTTGNAVSQNTSFPTGVMPLRIATKVRESIGIVAKMVQENNFDALPTIEDVSFVPGDSTLIAAFNSIDGITESLQGGVIKYLREYHNGLPYNKAKCYRDVGLITDAISKDIEYGGNANTLEAARYYFGIDNEITASYEQARSINVLPIPVTGQFSVLDDLATVSGLREATNILPEEQREPTKKAFQRLATVAQQIVTETTVTKSPGNGETQDTSGVAADSATGTSVNDLFSIIANIVDDNDLDDLDTTEVKPLADPNRTVARKQIQINKDFIIEEVIAYLNDEYFTFDGVKCKRDVGLIIDAVKRDVLTGSNFNAVFNGLAYRSGTVGTNLVIDEQLTETVSAIEYARDVAVAAVSDLAAKARTTQAFNEIIDIMGNGTGNADAIDFTADSSDPNRVNARQQLQNNKAFLKAEMTAYITQNFGSLVYDSAKCERDLGYIIDSVSFDIQHGGNTASINNATLYFENAVSVLPADQRAPTAAAFTHIANVAEQVANDQLVTVTPGNGVSQDRTADPAGATVSAAVKDLINIISDAVNDDGLDNIPSAVEPISATYSIEYQTALTELENVKQTIQDGVLAHLSTYFNTLSYNEDKCRRDTGYIIDAVSHDIQYGGNAATVTAAEIYFENAVSVLPVNQRQATRDAFLHLATVMNHITREIVVTPTVGNTETQNFSEVAANPFTGMTVQSLVEIVANTVDDATPATANIPAKVTPSDEWVASNYTTSMGLIEEASVNLASSVISFISNTYNGLSFPENKCRRDVGYLIDAVSHDVQYGGNYATRIAAGIYFENGVSVLPIDTREQTADVYAFLGTALSDIVQEIDASNTVYTDTVQDTSGTPATATEGARVAELIGYVEDIIRADNVDVIPALEEPDTSWVAADLIGAAQQIDDNRYELANDLVEFLRREFDVLDYNKAKCRRDTGYLLDAFSFDLNYGGNTASRWNAEFYFWNNAYRIPEDQRIPTAKSYRQLGRICKDIVLGKYSGQVVKSGTGTETESNKVEELANIFYLTQINNDTKYLPVKQEPDTTWVDDAVKDVQQILEFNKIDLAFDTVRYVNATYRYIDINLTRRDGLNLLKAIVQDFSTVNPSIVNPVYTDNGDRQRTRAYTAALFDYNGKHVFPVFNSTTPGLKYKGSVEDLAALASITGQKPNQAYIVATDYATNYYEGDIYYWNGSNWISDGANNTELLDAFVGAWERMRDYIVTNLSPDVEHTNMINGLINDCLIDNVLKPETLTFGSLVESIAHQFNGASAGVNRNALPLNFRNLGLPISAIASVLSEDGGRIRWSGADELNNQYFARGLRINGRTGRIEGRPFTSSVRKLARRASNSRAVI